MLDAALSYIERGFYVFPLQVNGKRPLRGSHGLLDAVCDTDAARRIWGANPWFNVGINCGRSGLFVVDVDPRNRGEETLADMVRLTGPLPPTNGIVLTPGGGRHYYYEVGADVPRKGRWGPGVDLQGAGGYVVAPPSTTLFGIYRWIAAPR